MSNTNIKSDPKSVKLEEIGSSLVSPATEEKQDEIIANQTDGSQISQIVDSNGAELEMIKENDLFNTANHGIVMYGLDRESNPKRYRQIDADADGHLRTHTLDEADNLVSPATEETLQSVAGFNIPKHDTRQLVYTDGVLTSIVYKLGGATVATKTLTYTDGNLTGETIL